MNAVEDIKDIRGPVSIPLDWWWVWGLLAVIVVIVAVTLFLRRRKTAKTPLPSPRQPAWEVALEAIMLLDREDLIRKGLVKDFYSRLSDITRVYIEERFTLHAPEMTTEEFMEAARRSDLLLPVQKEFLSNFLNSCDMVKFAKHLPDASDMRQALKLARAFIEEAK